MSRFTSLIHLLRHRLAVLVVAVALVVTPIAGILAPATPVAAARVVCHHLDTIDWWVITGDYSEYGGDYCHYH